jgi:hypothetical protein
MQSARATLPTITSVACVAAPQHPINCTILEKEITGYKMCVLIFSATLSDIFPILRRSQLNIS